MKQKSKSSASSVRPVGPAASARCSLVEPLEQRQLFTAMIGAEFVDSLAGTPSLAATQVAGVVPQGHFNVVKIGHYSGTSGAALTTPALTDSTGAGTSVTLTHTSFDGTSDGTSTTTPNGLLLHGEDKSGGNNSAGPGGPTATYTFNHLATGTYTLIAYIQDDGPATANLHAGSTTYYVTNQTAVGTGTPAFVQAKSTNANARDTGNYVEFTGLTPTAAGTITLTNTGVSLTASINALQIFLQTPTITVVPPANQTATAGAAKSVSLGTFSQVNAASPYGVDINWGDGTTDTKFSQTTVGAITAQSHAFAKAGSFVVTETITDAKGVKSNVATFTDVVAAPLGSISGEVFNDGNGDKKLSSGEFGLGLWTVYIDLKNTGSYVAGDPTTVTNVYGAWSFTNLAAGTYVIRVEQVTGTVTTTPVALTIKLAAGQLSIGNLFGEKATT